MFEELFSDGAAIEWDRTVAQHRDRLAAAAVGSYLLATALLDKHHGEDPESCTSETCLTIHKMGWPLKAAIDAIEDARVAVGPASKARWN